MKQLLIILTLTLTTSCATDNNLEYSFFIAGHTYGIPNLKKDNVGIYKAFKKKFNYIKKQEKIKMGFLLGDVVWIPEYWDIALKDLAQLQMPVYIVRGNHDGSLESFEKKFGKSYKKFFYNKDLFIILDLNLDHWNITGEQLNFLKEAILNDSKKARNIFIFSHQVFWYNKNMFKNALPNSFHGKAKELNYWTQIEPLLQKTNANIYIFSGDVGAFPYEKTRSNNKHPIEFSYHKINKITYITTGMGGINRDNFIIADVYKDSVSFRLINLNDGSVHSLKKLKNSFSNLPRKEFSKVGVDYSQYKTINYTLVKMPDTIWYKKNIELEETDEKYNNRKILKLIKKSKKTSYVYLKKLDIDSGKRYKISILAKKENKNQFLGLRIAWDSPKKIDAVFDLKKGTVVGIAQTRGFRNEFVQIKKLNNNWYECSIEAEMNIDYIKIIFGPTDSRNITSWDKKSSIGREVLIPEGCIKIEKVSFKDEKNNHK